MNATLVSQLALARIATAKYVSDLALAKKDGYGIITRMIPNMGYHYLNPKVTGFDVRKPAILVYEHRGSSWQLGALEWVYTAKPAKAPLPGARYGTFGAGCHYADGTFVPAELAGRVPADGAEDRSRVRLLAPAALHPARLALVSEPERAVRGHEPARGGLQQGLSRAISGGAARMPAPPATRDRAGGSMPRYLVERTFVDGLGIEASAAGALRCRELVERNEDAQVTWLHSYVSADGQTAFCVYEAPGPEAIRRAASRNGLPVDRIVRIRVVDPYFAG